MKSLNIMKGVNKVQDGSNFNMELRSGTQEHDFIYFIAEGKLYTKIKKVKK